MKLLLFYAFCIFVQITIANVARKHRIDEPNDIVLRTKRIDTFKEDGRKSKTYSRSKRIDKTLQETLRHTPVTNAENKNDGSSELGPTKNININKDLPNTKEKENLEDLVSNNEISRYPFLGKCEGKKINKTYVAPNCNPVTVESLMCSGTCDSNPEILSNDILSFKTIESCTFCGPTKYEKKLVFFQCHSASTKLRRRWKLEIRKILIPKSCGCLEDFCYNLNKVSNENNFSK